MLRIATAVASLIGDGLRWLWLALRSKSAVEAENLFLRRQLALYVERGVKPRRIDSVTRIALTILSRLFQWREALVVVRPETLLRWHRQGWKLFWRL
jgi:putative transposase